MISLCFNLRVLASGPFTEQNDVDGQALLLQVLWNSVVEKAHGNEKGLLGGLAVKNVKTGEVKDVPVSGLFFAIGHEPASKFLKGQVRARALHARDYTCIVSGMGLLYSREGGGTGWG